jgi:hypothetical protein
LCTSTPQLIKNFKEQTEELQKEYTSSLRDAIYFFQEYGNNHIISYWIKTKGSNIDIRDESILPSANILDLVRAKLN